MNSLYHQYIEYYTVNTNTTVVESATVLETLDMGHKEMKSLR